jgi:cbb3-type cytochrome oxidase subunit 1
MIEKPPGLFLKFANWVSEAMGKPTNIAFWFVLVAFWTLIFALGGPHLASGTWLPRWFTSTGYNFPLNLKTPGPNANHRPITISQNVRLVGVPWPS